MPSSKGKPTNPELRKEAKEDVQNSDKGEKSFPGQRPAFIKRYGLLMVVMLSPTMQEARLANGLPSAQLRVYSIYPPD